MDENVLTFLEAVNDRVGRKLKAETGPIPTLLVDKREGLSARYERGG